MVSNAATPFHSLLVEISLSREWRFKWDDKKCLQEAQKALDAVLEEVKAVDGFKKVDRVVCGGCMDFKVSGGPVPRARISATTDSPPFAFWIVTMRRIDAIGHYLPTSRREI